MPVVDKETNQSTQYKRNKDNTGRKGKVTDKERTEARKIREQNRVLYIRSVWSNIKHKEIVSSKPWKDGFKSR